MKKTKILISFILMSLAISLSSCKKEELPEKEEASTTQSSYKIYVDGDLLTESTDADLDILNGDLMGGSKDNNDISIYIAKIPEIGQTVNVDYVAYSDDLYNGGDGSAFTTLYIIGNIINDIVLFEKIEMYIGTVTRESKNKITFTGTYYDFIDSSLPPHTFHGEVITGSVIE